MLWKINCIGVAFLFIFILCSCSKPASDPSDDHADKLIDVINDGYGDYLLVPAGEFEMGDNFDEGEPDERPVHRVYLSDYYIGKYEVTNSEYKKFMDDGGYENEEFWSAGGFGEFGSQPLYWDNSTDADPRDSKKGVGFYKGRHVHGGSVPGHENFPANGVSWYEAMAYCSWLSLKTGHTYRLPTEAEWEKAARGSYEHNRDNPELGHQRRYPWGDDIDNSYGNFWNSGDPYDNGTTPVGYYDGSKRGDYQTKNNASPYGAYDMTGNVFEWCLDWYVRADKEDPHSAIDYKVRFSKGVVTDPKTLSMGDEMCLRSSDWHHNVISKEERYYHNPRCAFRNCDPPHWRGANFGFRCVREVDKPVLNGPYLGQKPPGIAPELFAPGIVPTEDNEALYGFFNNCTLFLYDRTPVDMKEWIPAIYRMELRAGKWTAPNITPFVGKPWYHYYPTAQEGEQVYFAWRGSPDESNSSSDLNIWRVMMTQEGWTKPSKLPYPINSRDLDTYPKVTADGTLYFFSNREGGFGGHDIYRSPSINGEHTTAENLGAPINTENDELDPFIAPDESYIIFCSRTLDGFGGFDLYVSFKKSNRTWSEPVNMGEGINTAAYDWVPYVTPDGKYFFFNSTRAGSWDIYWVDARIITDLKPDDLK